MAIVHFRVVRPSTSEGVRAQIIGATTDGRREAVSLMLLGTYEVPTPRELPVQFMVERFAREVDRITVFGETLDGAAIKVSFSVDLEQPATAEMAET